MRQADDGSMNAPFRDAPAAAAVTVAAPPAPGARDILLGLVPGLLLCAGVTLAAILLARLEAAVFGHAWLEPLVLAILLGAALRSGWTPPARFRAGIGFGAKTLLEIAVVLLGASLSAATLLAAGPALLGAIALLVAAALLLGYGIARLLGLPARMAILIASGNAICGNSAIAAVAPVIGADGRDVATSIAFTAVLGVVVVLLLPLLVPALALTETQYGVLAGMTVYAVPQVLAAAAPVGAAAIQLGTLVKLVRVLMLGPVVLVLSLLAPRIGGAAAPKRPPLSRLVPWFILGFLGMAALRSLDLLPAGLLGPIAITAWLFTILSMAALGLGVDIRAVTRAGGRAIAAVSLSLLALGMIGFGLIKLLGIA
jgi:uncharacterized integral membrane protein (TIGR00698 family)